MVRLSVVIITFNEEQNIERCLKSVHGVVDEIIVVDSHSTDRTEEICKAYNVQFFQHPFAGHIEQKNYAITLATNPYLLSLDADEALSPELKVSIQRVKENWDKETYEFNRLTSYCGKWIRHGGWYPDRKVRMFKKESGSWGGENPHDKFITTTHSDPERLMGDLLHYSYYTFEGHLNQVNKFTTIGATSAFAKGRKGGIFSILIKPGFKFIRDYFFLLGFLDGYYGFVIAKISAHATFMKYVKLKELRKACNS